MTEPYQINRRRHERFRVRPMYTAVTVQRIEGMSLTTFEGHAYDLSESGARIDVDEPLTVGERIAVCLHLPGEAASIFASGRVVRVFDVEDDPAARRVGVQFTRFLHEEDRTRLIRYLGFSAERLAA
jgi:c-di-GMP-binding flagellar brake protein YcgR